MPTKIEWCDETWSPITGCTKVSPGCTHCYAARLASGRLQNHPRYKGLAANGAWGIEGARCHSELLAEPLHWRKPRIVFVCSMSDLFHESVSFGFIGHVWATMEEASHHTFQVLTKRPERAVKFFETISSGMSEGPWPLPNVWLGVSVEDQKHAHRIDTVLQIPAAVHYVSLEPLLGGVDMASYLPLATALGIEADGREWGPVHTKSSKSYRRYLDWVIVGGETGPGARPMHPDWVRSIRDQCVEAGVPFFFKQHGEWLHEDQIPDTGPGYGAVKDILMRRTGDRIHFWPDGEASYRVGKKRSGRHLDGREWNEFPAATVRQP